MVGNIQNANLLGGWKFEFQSAEKMPQPLASAFYKLFGDRLGCTYTPEYLVATQVVNGINYMLIAKRTKLTSGGKELTDFVIVVINIPAGDIRGEKATVVSEKDATDFVLRDEIESGVKKALEGFTGATHKPILELGAQVVKGVNYHFICESRIVYPNAEPYLTRVSINNFQGNWTIVEIEKL